MKKFVVNLIFLNVFVNQFCNGGILLSNIICIYFMFYYIYIYNQGSLGLDGYGYLGFYKFFFKKSFV